MVNPILVIIAATLAVVLALWLCKCTSGSSSGRKVITAYTQPWCGACKRLAPEWEKLQQIAAPEIEAIKVDCSKDDCSAIDRYPTIVCNGAQYTGERTAEAMKAWALTA